MIAERIVFTAIAGVYEVKYDKFVTGIIILIVVMTILAIAAVYIAPANSTDANVSATGIPTVLPTAEPGTPMPIIDDSTGSPLGSMVSGPRTDNVTWIGAVQDSFGRPFGGVDVTLHLMTTAGEAFNVTSVAAVDLPHPGSYVFNKVPVCEDIIYAYAEARADVGEGVTYYARGNNFTLNQSRISSDFIVLHVPMPDSINLTIDSPIISPGNVAYVTGSGTGFPNSTLATAQLYLNGNPYKRSGTAITFLVDDESIVALPGVRTNVTDLSGRTSILLTGSSAGSTNVTAYTKIGISRNLTATSTVQVTA